MRKVTFSLNISLDGYCDHLMSAPSEELMYYFTEMMADVDLLFYGRITYQMMFPYWEDFARDKSGTEAGNKFALMYSQIERVVMSKSLIYEDAKTRIVRDSPAAELLRLKQLPGKAIFISSVSMLPEIITANLIDEFKLIIHPVIAGNGRQLLPIGSLQQQHNLKLVTTKLFENGCIALHYVKHDQRTEIKLV